jgi:anti-sigma B factor antagonist
MVRSVADRRDGAQRPAAGPPEPPGLVIDCAEEPGLPVIRLAGELDLSNAAQVRAAVQAALAGRSDRVALDLAGLEFMDSSGIAMLLALSQQVREVEVRHAAGAVLRVIQVTGLDQVLRLAG